MDDTQPLFAQISNALSQQIINGTLPEGRQVPSTTELASFYHINPATAAKGANQLVDAGILFKRRGIGMFVAEGARQRLLQQRRETFQANFVDPLLAEAETLGITPTELLQHLKVALAEVNAHAGRSTEPEQNVR